MILRVLIDQSGSVTELQRLLNAALEIGARTVYLLGCDDNEYDQPRIDTLLRGLPVPVFGGRFPTLVYNRSTLDRGWIVCALDHAVDVSLHHPLGTRAGLELELPARVRDADGLLVLVDAMSDNIDHLVAELYNHIGPEPAVIGGGAGSLSFERRPCIFSNEGMLSDGLQIVALHRPLGVCVRHGWSRLAGPYLVTGADGNTIKTLNYRPALEVYKDAIQAHCGEALRARPFFEMAKGFPFGIETLDAEMLVRDPVVASENGMTCVGEVPENAIVYVLQGVLDELLAAARDATASCGPDGASDLLLFDCISRRLYMNDGFEREMASINAGLTEGTNLVGALSLGEIANSSSGSIQFHNKAVVVGAAGRAPSATVTRQLQV